jgi:glycosidase
VRVEVKKIARFWLEEMRVDGFRLDAVPFLMEDHGKLAGSPGTHALLHEYADYVHQLRPDAFTVGEVYDSIGMMLTYYPDQLDSYFAFEVADSIIAAIRRESARGLLAPALRLQAALPNDRWSPFLRNHDQPRTRTQLGGDSRKARLASLLLLTMPGVPFVYYGEEIGMEGTKPDERIRTPMQWGRGHADGFTAGKPWEALQDDSLTTTVEAEESDTGSVLVMNRRLIHLRATNQTLANGTLVPLRTSEDGVAAYARRVGDRVVIVVANLTSAPVRGVGLSGDGGALPAGTWRVRDLLSRAIVAPVEIGRDGRLSDYEPLRELAPFDWYVLELYR